MRKPKRESASDAGQLEWRRNLEAVGGGDGQAQFFTRQELAEALRVSVSLLDVMVRNGELTCLRIRGNLVRFYGPHVVRDLEAASASGKRRVARRRVEGLKIPNSNLQAPEKYQTSSSSLEKRGLTQSTQGAPSTQRTERTQGT